VRWYPGLLIRVSRVQVPPPEPRKPLCRKGIRLFGRGPDSCRKPHRVAFGSRAYLITFRGQVETEMVARAGITVIPGDGSHFTDGCVWESCQSVDWHERPKVASNDSQT